MRHALLSLVLLLAGPCRGGTRLPAAIPVVASDETPALLPSTGAVGPPPPNPQSEDQKKENSEKKKENGEKKKKD